MVAYRNGVLFLLGNGREYINCRLREIGNGKKRPFYMTSEKKPFEMSRVCHEENGLRMYDMHKNGLGKAASGNCV